jgi:hypothetical protein
MEDVLSSSGQCQRIPRPRKKGKAKKKREGDKNTHLTAYANWTTALLLFESDNTLNGRVTLENCNSLLGGGGCGKWGKGGGVEAWCGSGWRVSEWTRMLRAGWELGTDTDLDHYDVYVWVLVDVVCWWMDGM